MRDKVIALENEAYGMVSVGIPVTVIILLCGLAVYNKIARIVAVKSAHDIEQRCFTTAAGAENCNEFSLSELTANAVKRGSTYVADDVFFRYFV